LIDEVRGNTSRSAYVESLIRFGVLDTANRGAARDLIRESGLVYTPSILADYVGNKVAGYFLADLKQQSSRQRDLRLGKMRILDPACGDGGLLTATWTAVLGTLKGQLAPGNSRSLAEPSEALCGIDNSPAAIRSAEQRLVAISGSPRSNARLLCANALFPVEGKPSGPGWKHVMNRFDASAGFDIIIANPPWGADTGSYQDKLEQGEFSFFKGQYDTADLFLELAFSIVKPDGYIAFILPDSLFSAERAALRKMLLQHSEIRYIGRFGEKIFENINRACTVLICRKGLPASGRKVRCLRLTPQFRRSILQGKATFNEAESALGHEVPQRRFQENRHCLFDIDLTEKEQGVPALFRRSGRSFRDYLWSTRGIELSKTGKVCRCKRCKLWMPYPSGKSPRCPHCGVPMPPPDLIASGIVSTERQPGYEPLLVGQTVRRYALDPKHWIATDKKGIKYKDRSIYVGPKIVIRKTGVGLSATIDYSNAFTNQVVYIFKVVTGNGSALPIESFLAILNSRAMYYYLTKSHGETEWRSHPYVTQHQILDLPLPSDKLETDHGKRVSQRLSRLVKPHLADGGTLPEKVDAEVEHLVAGLYGLSRTHYQAIYSTLEYVEELAPIKPLKNISISDIFARRKR